jgi:hypothetical protein
MRESTHEETRPPWTELIKEGKEMSPENSKTKAAGL